VIRVTIELWPGGNENRRHELADLVIARVGDAADGRARYAAITRRPHGPELGAEIVHLPRHGPLELVRHALEASTVDGATAMPASLRTRLGESFGSAAAS
jgi:hypothetical protein